jgi:hypothetical protein
LCIIGTQSLGTIPSTHFLNGGERLDTHESWLKAGSYLRCRSNSCACHSSQGLCELVAGLGAPHPNISGNRAHQTFGREGIARCSGGATRWWPAVADAAGAGECCVSTLLLRAAGGIPPAKGYLHINNHPAPPLAELPKSRTICHSRSLTSSRSTWQCHVTRPHHARLQCSILSAAVSHSARPVSTPHLRRFPVLSRPTGGP